MRKMLSLGMATMLAAVAITAWATAAPRHKTYAEITTVGINPLMLMRNSSGLLVQQYDLF